MTTKDKADECYPSPKTNVVEIKIRGRYPSTGSITEYTEAIVKWNNGNGALLCNKCNIMLERGFDHEDKAHYCWACNVINLH